MLLKEGRRNPFRFESDPSFMSQSVVQQAIGYIREFVMYRLELSLKHSQQVAQPIDIVVLPKHFGGSIKCLGLSIAKLEKDQKVLIFPNSGELGKKIWENVSRRPGMID